MYAMLSMLLPATDPSIQSENCVCFHVVVIRLNDRLTN